jgi:hypothetical protein
MGIESVGEGGERHWVPGELSRREEHGLVRRGNGAAATCASEVELNIGSPGKTLPHTSKSQADGGRNGFGSGRSCSVGEGWRPRSEV